MNEWTKTLLKDGVTQQEGKCGENVPNRLSPPLMVEFHIFSENAQQLKDEIYALEKANFIQKGRNVSRCP